MHDVVLIGPCAAGKSTLARRLRAEGLSVQIIAQEHSGIIDLWRRRPARALVFLDVNLAQVHRRGRPTFPAWLHDVQQTRLADARQAADLVVDTVPLSIDDVFATVRAFLAGAGIMPVADGSTP